MSYLQRAGLGQEGNMIVVQIFALAMALITTMASFSHEAGDGLSHRRIVRIVFATNLAAVFLLVIR